MKGLKCLLLKSKIKPNSNLMKFKYSGVVKEADTTPE
jgi:hypothetical protein